MVPLMQAILDYLFGAASFVPHGYCLLWRPDLVALHAISDGAIALAYLVIPFAILVFVRRRRDLALEHRRVAGLFAAFIVACALTHLASLATLWLPYYGLQGIVKAGAALISLTTAVALWPLMPKLLDLPSPSALLEANQRLAEETLARKELVGQLQRVNRDLEQRVARRTQELREATQRFELALSSSGITVFVQDMDLRYRWIHNPRLGMAAEDVVGREDAEILPRQAADQVVEVNRAVIADGKAREEEVFIPDPQDGDTYIRLHAAPERDADGTTVGVICALVDITAEPRRAVELRKVTDALAEANSRFDQALAGSSITMFRQDADLRYTWMYNPPQGLTVEDFIGHTDEEVLPEATSRIVTPAKRCALATGEPERIETAMRIGDRIAWYDMRIEPLLDEHGQVVALTSVAIDISAQKEYHHHLRVVMRELTHRSKNLLAVVQGIARQTAQSVDGLQPFVERFGARLQALARAHDILVDESWRGAAIEELIATQLGHVIERSEERIIASGPKVLLKPEAAQNLALAVHELSTNAAKYGALSNETGIVRVDWGPVDSGLDAPMFEIAWTESGGPPAVAPLPSRKGFGSVMIERLVPRAIDGAAELTYNPGGLVWRLRFPARYLVDTEVHTEIA
ncbi:MAG TPA: HWE histidine kinase domain-containing protein [Methylomirabilota bacterium]|nr:HWE histidine kinase domain-containing protein [Methylomirabilota bacterium]